MPQVNLPDGSVYEVDENGIPTVGSPGSFYQRDPSLSARLGTAAGNALGFPGLDTSQPTPEQLRSPNPINWPTRAPGTGLYSGARNLINRGYNAVAPYVSSVLNATNADLPASVRNAPIGQEIGSVLNTTNADLPAPIRQGMTSVTNATIPDFPGRGLLTSNNPTSPYFSGNTQNPGNPFQGPGGQNIPPQPTPGITLNSTPAASPATPPLPAPGAQARPTSTGRMPVMSNAPSVRQTSGGGGGGSASGNRIPPQSVNLGYGAPGVGQYIPTTGIGRGPGTYVPGGMTMIESPNGSGRMMAVPQFSLFGGGGGQTQPAASPSNVWGSNPAGRAAYGGPLMPQDITHIPVAGVNAPLGPLARTGTQNLPTSYILPGGSRLTPQGDVIPA